ncbi:MAG: addiction module protein [Leptolyngbyaceae cyanobacterium]
MDSIFLTAAALKLSAFERVQLIDVFWQSLDSADQTVIDRAWLEESQDRLSAFHAGEVAAIEGDLALAELPARTDNFPSLWVETANSSAKAYQADSP